ncbi:MAG: antitoxin [Spirochaetaceae bacterium]|nr:MAG: antitoxin [Spirochaetaceae bacterium]
MRTTLNLDQDVLEVARSLSAARGISIGAAVSALARRGISGAGGGEQQRSHGDSRFPTFSVAENAPSFGTEEVKQALDDE